MKAIWNDQIIAESDETIIVENNHYFPPSCIKQEFFIKTDLHSTCPWKGEASYYSVEVDGMINKDAAWYYPKTKALASHIQGYVAFWKGISIKP